jgi:hypothetical protein
MNFSTRIIACLFLLSPAFSAAETYPGMGGSVDHYDLAPSVQRAAGGPAIYPAGLSDPALANPPGPPPENSIPPPSAAGLPARPTPMVSPMLTPVGPATTNNLDAPYIDPGPTNSLSGGSRFAPWPPVTQTPVYPRAAAEVSVDPPAEKSWYARVDYFHWKERSGGQDFVTEDGPLFTLGYTRKIGIERFRGELFGGSVTYHGFDQFQATPQSDVVLIPLTNGTDYLGLRGEYELVLAPAAWEGRFALLAGVGSRFWIRGFPDGVDAQGNPVPSIQETWWTIYPYLGLETHSRLGDKWELYSESRVGATAFTYQFSSTDTNPLWPQPGIMANTEIGLRGAWFFLAARFEVMSWSPSPWVSGSNEQSSQPNSVMYTAGARMGIIF